LIAQLQCCTILEGDQARSPNFAGAERGAAAIEVSDNRLRNGRVAWQAQIGELAPEISFYPIRGVARLLTSARNISLRRKLDEAALRQRDEELLNEMSPLQQRHTQHELREDQARQP